MQTNPNRMLALFCPTYTKPASLGLEEALSSLQKKEDIMSMFYGHKHFHRMQILLAQSMIWTAGIT